VYTAAQEGLLRQAANRIRTPSMLIVLFHCKHSSVLSSAEQRTGKCKLFIKEAVQRERRRRLQKMTPLLENAEFQTDQRTHRNNIIGIVFVYIDSERNLFSY